MKRSLRDMPGAVLPDFVLVGAVAMGPGALPLVRRTGCQSADRRAADRALPKENSREIAADSRTGPFGRRHHQASCRI
jgi:hypothetical protein